MENTSLSPFASLTLSHTVPTAELGCTEQQQQNISSSHRVLFHTTHNTTLENTTI